MDHSERERINRVLSGGTRALGGYDHHHPPPSDACGPREERTMTMVLPMVHRNGTALETLVEQRREAGGAVREAIAAMEQMAPNGRDYYPAPGRFAEAVAQHKRRVLLLHGLLAELQAEAEAIADSDG